MAGIKTNIDADDTLSNGSENVIKAKEVQLVEKNEETNQTRRATRSEKELLSELEHEVSYRNMIGCRGIFILFLILFLVSCYVSCLFIYSAGFNCSISMCPGTSFFLIFAILNMLVFIFVITRWKNLVESSRSRAGAKKERIHLPENTGC